MKNIIESRTLYYKDIIENVNLEVQKGDFVGLLGLNGSGKSTLAKLIGGLLKPDCGYVKIF